MPGKRSRKVLYRKAKNGREISEGDGERPMGKQDEEGIVLPSKADHIRVDPGDCLEYITWGGGGLGDPLTRPAAKVALDVHRKLVTLQGARENYGVVVDPKDFTVEEGATAARRREMRVGGRGKGAREMSTEGGVEERAYNRGGSLEELVARCVEETGQRAPRPQWVGEPWGPHVGLGYVRVWYERMRERGYEGWDV